MIRNRLRSFVWLTATGALVATAAAVTGCSGQVSNGKVSSTSEPVSLSAISNAATTACAPGYAHPNVCCEAGPNQAASCLAYPKAPFTQCESGSTTYPDPRSCCSLDGNGDCTDPPPPPPADAGVSSGGSCAYTCPVGWYSPPGTNGAGSSSSGGSVAAPTCCETLADGSGVCTAGTSSASSGPGGSSSSSGGVPTSSSSSSGGPTSSSSSSGGNAPAPSPGPSSPPTTTCDACPPGWQTPDGEPLLCCSTAPDGTISCFSQGVPPPPPPAEDAGVSPPSSCFGGGGGGPDGSTFTQCGCSETINGIDYTATCTDPGGMCVCTIGSGTNPGTAVAEPPTSCNDVAALFSACSFPTGTNVANNPPGSSPPSGGSSGGSAGSSSSGSGGG